MSDYSTPLVSPAKPQPVTITRIEVTIPNLIGVTLKLAAAQFVVLLLLYPVYALFAALGGE